jgi:hypothetical protein
MFFALALPCVASAQDQPPLARQPALTQSWTSDENLRLLEVRLDNFVLTQSLSAYAKGRQVFLPLKELARLLDLAVEVIPEQGSANGFIVREERSFYLHAGSGTVVLAGTSQSFNPALVELAPDDIYVEAGLLQSWLPASFDIDLSNLSMKVTPTEPLPLQQRMGRQRHGALLGAVTATKDPGYPRYSQPYRLWEAPSIDQTVGVDLRRQNDVSYRDVYSSTFLAGDLLGMEASAYVGASEQQGTQGRMTLARYDPDGGLLGWAGARQVALGAIQLPGVTNVARTGMLTNGAVVSSYELARPTMLDSQSLGGDLPPSWDVELYLNDVLIGYQQSGADRRYQFNDIPLSLGANDLRLVFHGPQGQVREERRNFLIEDTIVKPGAFFYRVGTQQDAPGKARSLLQFDLGLAPRLTGAGGLTRVSVLGLEQNYSNAGLRWQVGPFFLTGDAAAQDGGGASNDLGAKVRIGGLGLSVNLTTLRNFTSEVFLPSTDPIVSRSRLRLDGVLPLGGAVRLPMALDSRRDTLASGQQTSETNARVSAYFLGIWATNQLRWVDAGGLASTDGLLVLGRGFGSFRLNVQAGYTVRPESGWTSTVVSVGYPVANGYYSTAGVARTYASASTAQETRYSLGLSKLVGAYGYSVGVSHSSSGELALKAELTVAFGREPRQARWVSDAFPMADTGSVSARVFVDKNRNGVMDADEEPIKGAALTVDGGRRDVRTNEDGIAYMRRLPVRTNVNVGLDADSLEDSQLTPQAPGYRIVPRPGGGAQLEFPVLLTSEIDGTVYRMEAGRRRGTSGLRVDLVDAAGVVKASAKTAPDGFYILNAVPPGDYGLRIAPEQLLQYQLKESSPTRVKVNADGSFVNGVDLVLEPLRP